MIFHILFDDQFGDYVIDQFAPYRDRVRYVIVLSKEGEPIQYIKRASEMEKVAYGTDDYKTLLSDITRCNAVVMHGLFSQIQFDIVRHLPKNVKLAWVLWGTEIYSRPETFERYLSFASKLLYRLKLRKDKQTGLKQNKTIVPMSILRRVDYCLNSSPNIFNEVEQFIGNPNLQNLTYSYFTLEKLVGEDMLDKRVNGRNILLGNSATLENNHLNSMWRLWWSGVPNDSKLYIPLSYNTPWVRNFVSRLGKMLYGKRSCPLVDYMPRLEYNKIVQSCSAFVCNHYRPNAFGNTLTALWLGARVYVSKYSAQTKFLQDLGLCVYITENDLKIWNKHRYAPLPDEVVEHNRTIIRQHYDETVMQSNIKTIMDVLDCDN